MSAVFPLRRTVVSRSQRSKSSGRPPSARARTSTSSWATAMRDDGFDRERIDRDRSSPPDRRPLLVIFRPLGVREFLTAIPAYHALAETFPHHRRMLAAPLALAPLARLCGGIDGVVPSHGLAPLRPELHGADVAINLDGPGPASHRILLATHPTRLVAFAHRDVLGGRAGPRWIQGEPEAERWCRMLEGHGIRANPFRLAFRHRPTLRPDVLGTTVIAPDVSSAAWHWPLERWVAVIRAERAGGRPVVLTGRPADAAVALQIAHRAGLERRAVRTGNTDLYELAALVAAAGRVVCGGDSAVSHLATAMGTPSVVLFGPTSSAESMPPTHRPWHRVLRQAWRPGPHDAQVHQGLLSISVDQVLEALSGLAATTPADNEAPRLLA